MALTAGTLTVTINSTTGAPSYSGSGLALAMCQAELTARFATLPAVPTVGQTTAPFDPSFPATASDVATAVTIRESLADDATLRCIAYAAAIVTEFTTNGKARITTSTIAGRLPAAFVPSDPIQAPAANVDLAII